MSLFLTGSVIIWIAFIVTCVTDELNETLILSILGASLIIHDAITSLKTDKTLNKQIK